MVKKLKPELFHYVSTAIFSKSECFDKLSEEIIELQQAIESNNIQDIAEEMADVEICIPYMNRKMYLGKVEFKIENYFKRIDFKDSSDMVLQAIVLYKKYGANSITETLCCQSTHLMCGALYCLYKDYNIDVKLVDEIISFKKQRTIRRRFYGKSSDKKSQW